MTLYVTHKLYQTSTSRNITSSQHLLRLKRVQSSCRSMYPSGFPDCSGLALGGLVSLSCLSRSSRAVATCRSLAPSLRPPSSPLARHKARASGGGGVAVAPALHCQRTTCRARENIRYSVALSPPSSQRTSPYLNLPSSSRMTSVALALLP